MLLSEGGRGHSDGVGVGRPQQKRVLGVGAAGGLSHPCLYPEVLGGWRGCPRLLGNLDQQARECQGSEERVSRGPEVPIKVFFPLF